jgi:predicted alpha/beta hydrolase
MAAAEPIALHTADGAELAARLYRGVGQARAGVVINCGTGLTQRLYRHLAAELARRGYDTLTYDYRGMGESRPPRLRGFAATKSDWAIRDFGAALARQRHEQPGRPVFVVGHSFGGQALGLSAASRDLAGIVLVAAQSGWVGHWRGAAWRRLARAWYLTVPVATRLHGYLPGRHGTGEDLPAGVAREWGRWCRTRGFVTGVHPKAREHFAAIRAPVLAFSFTDDVFFAPAAAVDELLSWLKNAPIEHRRIDPGQLGEEEIGHFGFFTRAVGVHLWPEVAAFFERCLTDRT